MQHILVVINIDLRGFFFVVFSCSSLVPHEEAKKNRVSNQHPATA